MIIHHHTIFGYKSLDGSGDILRTKTGQMDRTDGHSESQITSLTSVPMDWGWVGGWGFWGVGVYEEEDKLVKPENNECKITISPAQKVLFSISGKLFPTKSASEA